ncbi:hypothetical protein [Barrientosiimonas humi]|uniref:hypothetical protein n=1 Tax=Barrientosiimonas humi TaxID=999931 RepID=UPI00370D637A
MRARTIIPLSLPVLLVGGGLAVEKVAQSGLEGEVRTAVATHLPGERIESLNVRGRPYVASRMSGEVGTAYVRLAPGRDVERTALVQRLRTEDGKPGRVRLFVTLPYADRVASKPQLARDGSYTDRASIGGRATTYRAKVTGNTVGIKGAGLEHPRAELPRGLDWRVVGTPAAKERGVMVELDAQ